MAPVITPAQVGQELAFCLALGALAGALRAPFPVRGRGAVLPDILFVGLVLLLVQSYAAALSWAGGLRWYMVAAAAAGAGAAHGILGPAVRGLERLLANLALAPGRFLIRRAVLPAAQACGSRLRQSKARRSQKRAAKKPKKSLKKEQPLLYNSNV